MGNKCRPTEVFGYYDKQDKSDHCFSDSIHSQHSELTLVLFNRACNCTRTLLYFPDIILTESFISDRPVEVRHEAEDRLEVLDGAQQELVDHAEGLDDMKGRGRQIEAVILADLFIQGSYPDVYF